MSMYIGASDITLIGGSFAGKKRGGHNVLEPAALKKPILIGPSYYNFNDAVTALQKNHAITICDNAQQIASSVVQYKQNPNKQNIDGLAAYKTYEKNRGSVKKNLQALADLIKKENGMLNQYPTSICILKLSALGDICWTIPTVQAIQRQWPKTQITWIVGKTESLLINNIPELNVIVLNKKKPFQQTLQLYKKLKNEKFDLLLNMQTALRASLISLAIPAKIKLGFSKNRSKECQWLFVNKQLPQTKAYHQVDVMADFARYLNVPLSAPTWHIPLNNSDHDFAKKHIQKKTCIISPCGSKQEKNWPAHRYAAIADHLHEHGYQIILTSSANPSELQLTQQIENQMTSPATNLAGITNLLQLTALIKRADLVITPDSGPAHLATTQNTPVIALYAHHNPEITGPYYDRENVVSAYKTIAERSHGKPISALPWGTRNKGDNLMEEITLDDVLIKINIIIKKNNSEKLTVDA